MAVDVHALTTSYGHEIRRVRTEALLRFRGELAQELQGHPERRQELLEELRLYRLQLHEAGEEELEDIVLDAMDMVTGWAARDARV